MLQLAAVVVRVPLKKPQTHTATSSGRGVGSQPRQRRALCVRSRADATAALDLPRETDVPTSLKEVEPRTPRSSFPSAELKLYVRNGPSYKFWVQRWWAASTADAVELLASVPEADIDAVDDRGETKLLQAARLAQTDIVKASDRQRGEAISDKRNSA